MNDVERLEGMRRERDRENGLRDYEVALAGLTENTNALRLAVVPEEDYALVANHLRSIEVELAAKRRDIEKEAEAIAQAQREANPASSPLVYESDRGKLKEVIERTYSFNDSGILAVVIETTGSIGEALRVLREVNALELKWKISYLETLADRVGFDLPRTRREVEDGDPDFLVGVVSKSKMVRG